MNSNFNRGFRVAFESRENYVVLDHQGRSLPAKLAGRLRLENTLPAVGDWVKGIPQPGEWILIEAIHPRSSVLERLGPDGQPQILAANVDSLLIVTSANQDLNLNRLDRYVAMADAGGVRPVVVINKIELVEEPGPILDQVAERYPGVDVHGTSALENWNVDGLEAYLSEGQTVALVGSSGVGKSSLTNALLGGVRMETQSIRADDDRGRHTTTHRELHMLANGAALIDTPGLRSLALSDEDGLDSVFADIADLSTKCRFGNCQHKSEPGCAILKARDSGELEEDRWQNYLKLQKELAHHLRKTDKALMSVQKKKWAKINQDMKKKLKAR